MKYMKAFLQFVGAVLMAITAAAMSDNSISTSEWFNVAVIGLGVAPIALIPNTTYFEYAKSTVAGLVAAVVLASTLAQGGVSGVEWLQLLVAFGTTAGVWVARNQGDTLAVQRRLLSARPTGLANG